VRSLKKRINIENKDIWGLDKVKGENESLFLGRSLSFIFLGAFFGRCSKKKRDKRGSNESVKVV